MALGAHFSVFLEGTDGAEDGNTGKEWGENEGWARGPVPRRTMATIRVMIGVRVDTDGDLSRVASTVSCDRDDLLRSIVVNVYTIIAVQYRFHLFSPRHIRLACLRDVGDEFVREEELAGVRHVASA